jgi:hypothetical protein
MDVLHWQCRLPNCQYARAGIDKSPLQAAYVPALSAVTLDEFIFQVKQYASFGKYIFHITSRS